MTNFSRSKLFNVLTDPRMRIHFHGIIHFIIQSCHLRLNKVSNDLLAETQTRLNQQWIRTTRDSLEPTVLITQRFKFSTRKKKKCIVSHAEDMDSVPKDSKNVFLRFFIALGEGNTMRTYPWKRIVTEEPWSLLLQTNINATCVLVYSIDGAFAQAAIQLLSSSTEWAISWKKKYTQSTAS